MAGGRYLGIEPHDLVEAIPIGADTVAEELEEEV